MLEQWKKPEEIKKLGNEVEQELRKVVTERWGIRIHQVYITDVVPTRAYKILDGTPPPMMPVMAHEETD